MPRKLAIQFLLCLLLPATLLAEEAAQPGLPAPEPIVAPGTALPETEKLLGGLVDGAIIPLYTELEATGKILPEKSRAFCADVTAETFAAVRDAWGETLLAWERTDALLFGPAIEEQVDFAINFSPPKKLVINRLLTSVANPLTVDMVAKAGVGGQGLSTLEFLLFDRGKTDAQMLALFQGEAGQRRCDYVVAASELLYRNISKVTEPWLREENSYADAFRTARGSPVFVGPREAIDLLVGKLFQSAEKTARQKTGMPLGKGMMRPGSEGHQEPVGQGNPYKLAAWRSGYGIKVIRANMEGIQRILQEGGLLQWLRDNNERGAEKFVADMMEQRLGNYLNLPLPEADPFELIEQGKLNELNGYYFLGNDIQRGIKRQLARVMGVQLGFNDNDGD